MASFLHGRTTVWPCSCTCSPADSRNTCPSLFSVGSDRRRCCCWCCCWWRWWWVGYKHPHTRLTNEHDCKVKFVWTLPLGFLVFAAVLLAALVSSNGRHLKSLLYPPHCTLRRSHWRQVGLDSSHFKRLVLQVIQPGESPIEKNGQRPALLFFLVFFFFFRNSNI